MQTIRGLFSASRPLDRPIEKVIDYYATDDARLAREVEEYEVTAHVEASLRRFLDHFERGARLGDVTEVGIWVSGFYGSGKSSFTKYLGFALDPRRQVGGRAFLDLLSERINSPEVRAQLRTTATKTRTAVVLLDLAAEQLADTALAPVATVLYWKVLQWAGYSREKKLAQLEFRLDELGQLDAFRQAYREQFPGKGEWEEIHDDPLLGVSRADALVGRFLPAEFPEKGSFRSLKFEEALDVREQARRMIDIVRRRSGCQAILFLVDEAGQYVAPRGELILNLDGLARNLKELGKGKVWLVATGQQTLTEIVEKAARNSAELNKLRDRFPISLHLDAADIREITYRRLLTKSPEGARAVATLFDRSGQAALTFTRLQGTILFKGDPERDLFLRFYPFLPQHFDLLLELIRTLARSTGGVGLRSAIRVIQDILVDASRTLPAGRRPLAERPVGSLACVDDFYDTLRVDLGREFRHAVEGVERVERAFEPGSLEVRVAKAVAALQPINGFPRTAENLAALLYPGLGSPGLADEVRSALAALVDRKEFGLVEDPQAGGFLFLSEGVKPLRAQRDALVPTGGEINALRVKLLAELFDPVPSVELEKVKRVQAGVRFGRAQVVGEGADLQFVLEAVEGSRFAERRQRLLADTAGLSEYRNSIVWLVDFPGEVEDLLTEAVRSEKFLRAVPEGSDKDVAQFLRSERRQKDVNSENALKLMRRALEEGVLIFRGGPTPAAEAGESVLSAARRVLEGAAALLFPHLRLAAVRPPTDLAAKFLGIDRLDRMPADLDPLKLVAKKSGQARVDPAHPALAEVLRVLRERLDQSGAGRIPGNTLQDEFAAAPYGWSKDATRYLLAALLVAGEVELHTSEGTLTTRGPSAVEAFRSTLNFNRVGVSLRGSRPSLEALDRAADRLTELFGGDVIPLEDKISAAVRKHVPELMERLGSLPDRLRLLSLVGEDRARRLLEECTELLRQDAGAATSLLGAADTAFPADVRWARDLARCLNEGGEDELRRVQELLREMRDLEQFDPEEAQALGVEEDRSRLAECLRSDDLPARMADLRGAVRRLLEKAAARYAELRAQVESGRREALQELERQPEWARLDPQDQEELGERLLRVDLPEQPRPGQEVTALGHARSRRAGLSARLGEVEAEVRRRAPAPPPPPPAARGVERIPARDLAPKGRLTSEAEVASWLEAVRARVTAALQQDRDVEIVAEGEVPGREELDR